MKQLWNRFSHRTWMVVLAAAFLGAGLSFLQLYGDPYRFTSTATVYVTPPVSSGPSDAMVGDQYAASRTQLYLSLIQSSDLARAVIDRSKINESPDEVKLRISARATPQTSLLTIQAKGRSPSDARDLATAYVETLPDFAKSIENASGPRGGASVIIVGAPSTDTSPYGRYLLIVAFTVIFGFLGFLYSRWRRRRHPNVWTPEQLRRELHVGVTEAINVDAAADDRIRRLQAELFSTLDNQRCMIIASAGRKDGAALFSDMLSQSIQQAGSEVRRVGSASASTEPGSALPEGIVLFDAPALLESNASAAALQRSNCKEAILVTRRNLTTLSDARDLCELLTKNNVTVRGAVVLRRGKFPWRRHAITSDRHAPTRDQAVADDVESNRLWPVIEVLEAEKR